MNKMDNQVIICQDAWCVNFSTGFVLIITWLNNASEWFLETKWKKHRRDRFEDTTSVKIFRVDKVYILCLHTHRHTHTHRGTGSCT